MDSKIHKLCAMPRTSQTAQLGFTIIELLISVAIILAISGVIMLVVRPTELRQRGRDEKRLSDISVLERALSEYVLDNQTYPDAANTLRISTSLPLNNSGPLEQVTAGWLSGLDNYLAKLPTDPINNATYFYSYQHNGKDFELNAQLEYYVDLSANDGGTSDAVYEVGSLLTIL